jgi:ribose 5-phosphate isomerase B
MRVCIGSDHAGFALKQHLVGTLSELGHEVDDIGTTSKTLPDFPGLWTRMLGGGQ